MEKNSSTRVSRFRRLAGFALIAAIAVTAAGCGMVKVSYRNGDTVGLFMINRYLDLTSEQKEFVKPKLRELLAWHKKTQLPDYAAFATEMQAKAHRQIAPADVAVLNEQSRRKAMATVDHALPELADVALKLTSANIRALQEKFAEDDADWKKDNFGDLEKQQKKRYEKTLERVEEWYGKLSREQRAAVRQWSDARPLDNDILLAERQRREQEIVTLLTRVEKEKPSRDAVIAMMKTYADRFDQSPVPERRAFIDTLRRASDDMNAQIHNQATKAQRDRAATKLQEWIDDFHSLASDAN